MLRSSKIEAIAEWHWSMATIFEFICYHVHVAGWLRKWPKWAIGSTSAARPCTWHVRKSPDNVNIRWYRYLSGKKVWNSSVRKTWDRPPPANIRVSTVWKSLNRFANRGKPNRIRLPDLGSWQEFDSAWHHRMTRNEDSGNCVKRIYITI